MKRSEITKRLTKCSPMNGTDFAEACDGAVDEIEAYERLLERTRWIRVSERLPEYSGYVLAVFEKCLPFVAMYYSGVKKFSCEGEEAYPTHWMPLPLPPDQEG